jgi:octaprenyl-diphosphate synthase
MIRRAIEEGGTDDQGRIRAVVESTGGLEYTAELAGGEAEKAVAALEEVPPSPYREALAALARFAASRDA